MQPLTGYKRLPAEEMIRRANEFLADVQRRRTVREFESQPLPEEVIEACLKAATTAPSGANLQPWRFIVVQDPELRRRIREAAEEEERVFYDSRAPQEWLDALDPLGTDWRKPFLEEAGCLIAIFAERYGVRSDGRKVKHYYVQESVGIATGILITAFHRCGVATLTHTPSPMNFLNDILGRPSNERPFLLLVAGYPSDDATVPALTKKPFDQMVVFI